MLLVLKETGQHGIREMIKLCLLNFAESGKGSFYILREWLEGYEYGKGMFYSEYGDDKNYTSYTMPTTCSRRIVFFLVFFPIFSDLRLLLSGYEKRLLQEYL